MCKICAKEIIPLIFLYKVLLECIHLSTLNIVNVLLKYIDLLEGANCIGPTDL